MKNLWTIGLVASLPWRVARCGTPLSVRSQSPDPEETSASRTRLVGDLAVPYGLHPIVVESVGFVTGLRGTGSDPDPSPQRALVMREMQRSDVENPNALLASPNTAVVLVKGSPSSGNPKDDRFDLEVRIPRQSETTSLRGGTLWPTELKQLAVMSDNRIHRGHSWHRTRGRSWSIRRRKTTATRSCNVGGESSAVEWRINRDR